MKNKYQRARILIIDRELSKGILVKTQKLQKLISQAGIAVSTRQIEKDIEHMQEDLPVGYSAPIAYDKRRKGFYYSDPEFTTQALGWKNRRCYGIIILCKNPRTI